MDGWMPFLNPDGNLGNTAWLILSSSTNWTSAVDVTFHQLLDASSECPLCYKNIIHKL